MFYGFKTPHCSLFFSRHGDFYSFLSCLNSNVHRKIRLVLSNEKDLIVMESSCSSGPLNAFSTGDTADQVYSCKQKTLHCRKPANQVNRDKDKLRGCRHKFVSLHRFMGSSVYCIVVTDTPHVVFSTLWTHCVSYITGVFSHSFLVMSNFITSTHVK